MALVNALYDLAAPPHPGGQAIWGVFPKRRPDLPPLGAEIGAAVADCLAVLAYGLSIEFDQESVHLLLGGSHALANASTENHQWRSFPELMQLEAFSDLITPHSDDDPDWDRLVRHLAYWACRGGDILLAHCLSIDTAYTGRSYKQYVHIRKFRAVGRSEESLVAWSHAWPVLPTFEPDSPLSRADVVEQLIHGAGEGGYWRFFDVRFDATTERFTAITRTNHRGDDMTFALRQQCFDAVVDEEAVRGPSIGDQIAAALCHAFYLALKNDPPDRPGHRLRAPVPVGTLESIYPGGGSCSSTSLLLHGAKQGDWRRAPHLGIATRG